MDYYGQYGLTEPVTDLLTSLRPDCEMDDALRFLPTGVILIDRGHKNCEDEEEIEEEIGTFTYDSSTKVLTRILYESNRESLSVLEYTSATEVVLVNQLKTSGGMHTIRTRLKAR